MLLCVGLFIKMSNGAVYTIVPFVNRPALGSVAGIVGAEGNVGAVCAGFLFQSKMSWPTVFWLPGLVVCSMAVLSLLAAWGFLCKASVQPPAPGHPTKNQGVTTHH